MAAFTAKRPRKGRRVLHSAGSLAAFTMVGVLALAGCTTDTPTEPGASGASSDEVCTADRVGGTVTFGSVLEVLGVDPIVALGSGVAGASELTAFYDTLMRYVPDTGEFVPFVAESLTPNDDNTEWTLTLRDGITFGNGDPLTSDAVKFSVERMAASTRQYASLATAITSMDVVDDLTITFTMDGPNGTIPYLLSTEGGMVVNPALVEERGEGYGSDPTGGGVGPFEFTRFAPGEELVLTAKDDYWGGQVCIEELHFINIPGAQGTYEAFQQDELDVAMLVEQDMVNQARNDGFEAYYAVAGGQGNLFMNNREGSPTSDLRVRLAVVHAIDVDVIDQRINNGEGLPSSAVIYPTMRLYDGVDGPQYDPEKAKQLVDEVKAEGWDGTIRLLFADDQAAVDRSIVIESLLTNVGMTVVRENIRTADVNQRIFFDHDYDIGERGLAVFDNNPQLQLEQFSSTSNRSRTGYNNPEMDTAVAKLIAASEPDDIKAAVARIQEIWNENPPAAEYSAVEWFIAAHPTVKGLQFSRDVSVLFNTAYIEQ